MDSDVCPCLASLIRYAQANGHLKPSRNVLAIVGCGNPFWTSLEYADGFDTKFRTAFASLFDAAVGNDTISIHHESQANITADGFIHASFWINELIGNVF